MSGPNANLRYQVVGTRHNQIVQTLGTIYVTRRFTAVPGIRRYAAQLKHRFVDELFKWQFSDSQYQTVDKPHNQIGVS